MERNRDRGGLKWAHVDDDGVGSDDKNSRCDGLRVSDVLEKRGEQKSQSKSRGERDASLVRLTFPRQVPEVWRMLALSSR